MRERMTDEEIELIKRKSKAILRANYSLPKLAVELAKEDVPKMIAEIDELKEEVEILNDIVEHMDENISDILYLLEEAMTND